MHSERDFPRLVRQAKAMSAALTDAGVTVETMEMEDADHLEANEACGFVALKWVCVAKRWLAQCADNVNSN